MSITISGITSNFNLQLNIRMDWGGGSLKDASSLNRSKRISGLENTMTKDT